MRTNQRIIRRVGAAIAGVTLALSLSMGGVAQATSGKDTERYPNKAVQTGNAWIQTISWTGCGKFKTSNTITKKPNWIDNRTRFYQIGIGSMSMKNLSIGSSRNGNHELYWKNTNGAKGSYLSGSICGGWGAVYVGLDMFGNAKHYGTTRQVHVRL